MKKLLLVITCLLFSANSHAEELPDWYAKVLKVKNPNELAYYAYVDTECGITGNQLQETIEDIMIRSRIKPVLTTNSSALTTNSPIYLRVVAECGLMDDDDRIYNLSIDFARYIPKPAVLYDMPYGSFGVAPADLILNKVKNYTEEAITDYIKVNFDL